MQGNPTDSNVCRVGPGVGPYQKTRIFNKKWNASRSRRPLFSKGLPIRNHSVDIKQMIPSCRVRGPKDTPAVLSPIKKTMFFLSRFSRLTWCACINSACQSRLQEKRTTNGTDSICWDWERWWICTVLFLFYIRTLRSLFWFPFRSLLGSFFSSFFSVSLLIWVVFCLFCISSVSLLHLFCFNLSMPGRRLHTTSSFCVPRPRRTIALSLSLLSMQMGVPPHISCVNCWLGWERHQRWENAVSLVVFRSSHACSAAGSYRWPRQTSKRWVAVALLELRIAQFRNLLRYADMMALNVTLLSTEGTGRKVHGCKTERLFFSPVRWIVWECRNDWNEDENSFPVVWREPANHIEREFSRMDSRVGYLFVYVERPVKLQLDKRDLSSPKDKSICFASSLQLGIVALLVSF